MDIRPFQADDGMLIKRVRLRSLADAPYAFGAGTFAEEAALPDAHWHQLAAQVGGQAPQWRDRCVSYVVLDGDDACGTATCYLCPRVPRHAYFTSAWIDPRHRRRGLGRQLVVELQQHAKAAGGRTVFLLTTTAAPFFEQLGYERVARDAAPGFIAASTQFSELCPGSAQLMMRRL